MRVIWLTFMWNLNKSQVESNSKFSGLKYEVKWNESGKYHGSVKTVASHWQSSGIRLKVKWHLIELQVELHLIDIQVASNWQLSGIRLTFKLHLIGSQVAEDWLIDWLIFRLIEWYHRLIDGDLALIEWGHILFEWDL